MKDCNYKPNGEVQGDSRSIPDRGVSTGVSDTYGADLSGDATNRTGGMGRAAKSDKWADNSPGDEMGHGD